ncbi:MAG TPA: Ig-like domain-containing protein, partial [Rubrobacter sp.]|nr:Ig-like domain-containing protein [Rubrobacter sp.]
PTANVIATFSEAMNEASVEKTTANDLPTTFTLKKKGTTKTLAATVVYSEPTATTFKAGLDPTRKLRAGATYIATVSSVATDLVGNALDQNPSLTGNQPKTWTFTVKP